MVCMGKEYIEFLISQKYRSGTELSVSCLGVVVSKSFYSDYWMLLYAHNGAVEIVYKGKEKIELVKLVISQKYLNDKEFSISGLELVVSVGFNSDY